MNCKQCGKKLSHSRIVQKAKFCDMECYSVFRFGPKVVNHCVNCGIEIKSKEKTRKYCSFECRNESYKGKARPNRRNRKVKPCDWCGKDVERPASMFRGDLTFCGYDCMARHQSKYNVGEKNGRYRGGVSSARGVGWRDARLKCIKSKKGICEVCGGKGRHVHHKLPFRFFTDCKHANKQSNLMLVCAKCHPKVEKEARDAMPLFDRYCISADNIKLH